MSVQTEPLLDVAIAARRVTNRERVHTILEDVRFSVRAGEFVTLVGPSGCGKTTLLRCVAGLDREFEGRIELAGAPVVGPGLDRGVVFQEPRLMPWMSVRENVRFAARGRAAGADGRVEQLLRLVGLGGFEQHWPKQLSGGMAQRAGLARALVNVPRLLLLDEPLGALDNFTRARMQQELRAIVDREGVTTLLVTHDIDEALILSDRILVMGLEPGTVRHTVDVDLAHPRNRNAAEFVALRAHVESLLPEGQIAAVA